jgi:hypothetical protein
MICSECISFIYIRGKCFCDMKKFENIPLTVAKNFEPGDCEYFDDYDDYFMEGDETGGF